MALSTRIVKVRCAADTAVARLHTVSLLPTRLLSPVLCACPAPHTGPNVCAQETQKLAKDPGEDVCGVDAAAGHASR